MPDPKQIAHRLLTEGEKTLEFFGRIAAADWSRTVYTEGAHWTVAEVLNHFVNTESGIARLVRSILEGGAGVAEDFDLDAYNERKVKENAQKAAQAMLDEFSALRAKTVAMVSAMTEADLLKEGRHPFLGIAPVENMLKLMYRHNQIHQRDLRRLLSTPEKQA